MSRWSTRSRSSARARRAGFTLIELLAVLFIISILAYFLVTNLTAGRDVMDVKLTKGRLASISAALEEYASESGDYPPTTFADTSAVPNDRNLGAESLYLVLCREGGPGEGDLDQALANSDNDAAARRVEGHQTLELHEITDTWGNPIAYFHHRDYGREDLYVTLDAQAATVESRVRALADPKLARPFQPRKFQLISAGPNGVFGTAGGAEDDDITSFKR